MNPPKLNYCQNTPPTILHLCFFFRGNDAIFSLFHSNIRRTSYYRVILSFSLIKKGNKRKSKEKKTPIWIFFFAGARRRLVELFMKSRDLFINRLNCYAIFQDGGKNTLTSIFFFFFFFHRGENDFFPNGLVH